MSVKQAILGLVIEQPGGDHDLERRCLARMPTAAIGLREIEDALAQLEREGSVRYSYVTDPVRQMPRSVYEATPEGIDRFEEWLHSPPAPGNAELEAFRKIGAGQWSAVDRLIEITYEHEAAALARLTQMDVEETFPEKVERLGLWQATMEAIGQEAEDAQIRTTLDWFAKTRDWLYFFKETAALEDDGPVEDDDPDGGQSPDSEA